MDNTSNLVGLREDRVKEFLLSNPNSTPLLRMLANMGRISTTDSITTDWIDYLQFSASETLDADIDNAVTSLDISSENGLFLTDRIIRIGEEAMQITGVAGTTLTVTRAFAGTTAVAHTKGEKVLLISNGRDEGDEFDAEAGKIPLDYSNYTQIITTTAQMSGTEMALDLPGADGIGAWEKRQLDASNTQDIKTELMLMSGVGFKSGTKRGSRGIGSWLDEGIVFDATADTSQDVSYEKLESMLAEIFKLDQTALTSGEYVFMVNPVQKTKLDKLLKDYIRVGMEYNTLGSVVDYIRTSYGEFPIIMSINVPSNAVYLVNMKSLEAKGLNKKYDRTRYFIEDKATNGATSGDYDGKKGTYLSEMTLVYRQPFLGSKYINLSV
jgi:hypothetical protein